MIDDAIAINPAVSDDVLASILSVDDTVIKRILEQRFNVTLYQPNSPHYGNGETIYCLQDGNGGKIIVTKCNGVASLRPFSAFGKVAPLPGKS